MDRYDIVIIGAGISGATLAERHAVQLGKKVLVLESRDHIGGNCHDYIDEHGVLVPKYGPHFFHTDDEGVWEYVSRFTEWHPYEHRVRAHVDGKTMPMPVNLETVNTLFAQDLATEEDMKAWLSGEAEDISSPVNSEEIALSRFGRRLYEKLFKNYTEKQWGKGAHELDPSVMARIPIRTNNDDRYFSDKYQALPAKGYTELFKRMLDHPNITVRLSTDYFKIEQELKGYEKLFFTGPIDAFFRYKYGRGLQYRSLRFELTHFPDIDYYQDATQINFPNDYEYTRITEPKHATGQKIAGTTIVKEFPMAEGEPYYPVPTPENQRLYEQYRQEAIELEKKGIYFVGRLANYKYFNMDQAFRNALDIFNKLYE